MNQSAFHYFIQFIHRDKTPTCTKLYNGFHFGNKSYIIATRISWLLQKLREKNNPLLLKNKFKHTNIERKINQIHINHHTQQFPWFCPNCFIYSHSIFFWNILKQILHVVLPPHTSVYIIKITENFSCNCISIFIPNKINKKFLVSPNSLC